jgi:hypothetical protein
MKTVFENSHIQVRVAVTLNEVIIISKTNRRGRPKTEVMVKVPKQGSRARLRITSNDDSWRPFNFSFNNAEVRPRYSPQNEC